VRIVLLSALLLGTASCAAPPGGIFASPGRLTLSNFTYELADVEAVVTPYPDCGVHAGIVPMDFKLPLNSTWVIPASLGSDVCWRHHAPPSAGARTAPPPWSDWNRAFTAAGSSVDSRL